MQPKTNWISTKIGSKDKEEITIIVDADDSFEADLLALQEANVLGYDNYIATHIVAEKWRVQLFNIKRRSDYGTKKRI